MENEFDDFDSVEVTPGLDLRRVVLYVGVGLAMAAFGGDLMDGVRDFNGKGVPQVVQALTSASSAADGPAMVQNTMAGKDFELIREERADDKKPLIAPPSSVTASGWTIDAPITNPWVSFPVTHEKWPPDSVTYVVSGWGRRHDDSSES